MISLGLGCASVKSKDGPDGGEDDSDGGDVVCAPGAVGWQRIGSPIVPPEETNGSSQARMTLDDQGNSVLAVLYGDPRVVQVYRQDGNSFSPLGAVLDALPDNTPSYAPRIANSSDGLVVSTVEWRGSSMGNAHYIYRYDGNNFTPVGGDLSDTSIDTIGHEIAAGPDGDVYVASSQTVSGTTGDRRIWVHKVEANGLTQIGTMLGGDGGGSSFVPDIDIDGDGNLYTVFAERGIWAKARGNANPNWTSLGNTEISPGGSVFGAHNPHVAVTDDGDVYLSANERADDADASQIYIMRWTGSAWQQIGSEIDFIPGGGTHSHTKQLIVDREGRPTVVFTEREPDSGPYHLYVARYDAGQWVRLGAGAIEGYPDGDNINSADLVANKCGLTLTFPQAIDDASEPDLHVFRFSN